MTPQQLMSLNTQVMTLMFETQTVMALRLMAISGAIPARKGENDRMVQEKAPAFAKAVAAGTAAAIAGKRPDEVMSASLAPLSRKVRSNRKRLMK